ncbi:MAG: putative 3-hydroxybutyryl-CoA dehydrogenase [Syntrophaceae bacterium PtaB.Bin095]|jgi:3-hydroxybutyryl-CoA dehydrogenase|nr:MAG: putative 3-hydroxybutyryl-CoA dehydrogenase [Syntrophaceae bacterium PtaB.Bin095]
MIKKLCVIGAGTMGAGIAQVAVEKGIEVAMRDVEDRFVEKGLGTIRNFLGKKVEKGKLSAAERDAILGRLKGTTSMEKAAEGADMVIEAVIEDLALKQKVFAELDRLCVPGVILASNTSTLSITKIASVTKHPTRVLGTHFFSPVPVMRLVEVISGEQTDAKVLDAALEVMAALGKTAIRAKDVPGFIVNRFLCLLYNEAADQIYKGYATAQDIDLGLKLGSNHPMGPVEIMDMAGVDVVNNALKALYEMTGEERYKPSPLFEQMIRENRLGRKTGRGFYEYTK